MGQKLHIKSKKLRKCHKETILYCLKDMKDINNLAIISHMVQQMWMQEKSQKPNQRDPGG